MDIVAIYHSLTVDPPRRANDNNETTTYAHDTDDISAYVARALTDECGAVRNATAHRNDRLNQAAFSLGTLIGAGVLDRQNAESELTQAAIACGLEQREIYPTIQSGIESGIKQPRRLPESARRRHAAALALDTNISLEDAQAIIGQAEEIIENADAERDLNHNPWPYGIHEGRMIYQSEDGEEIKRFSIADFTAAITEEIIDENGDKTFVIEGVAIRGGAFRFEIAASRFGEDRALRSALEQAAGARDPVYARMSGHLVPCIKKLTRDNDLQVTRRFVRTGWTDGKRHFVMPGLEANGTRIELPSKLPYRVEAGDTDKALLALDSLIQAIDPAATAPVLAMMFQAPIQRLIGWHKKYGVFIQGRTGSLKTSWTQAAMSIYGTGFIEDSNLLKWGEGATRNAILQYATTAHDLPFFLDNYKPNTGDGEKGFTNLIHNIIEGGNRERLRRDASLITSQPIHAFPLVTGEDVPESDAASLARIFVIEFPWQRGDANPHLTKAQRYGKHLSTIGHAWLEWIMQPETRAIFDGLEEEFDQARERWSDFLRRARQDIGNPLRVAENLASNEIAWRIACQHPLFGKVLQPYAEQHREGLARIALRMANGTADALEAIQFISTIRELLISKRHVLVAKESQEFNEDGDRILGWYDNQGIYLLPALALSAVRRLNGTGSIPISTRALYDQMDKLGMLAVTGGERTSKTMKINGKVVRVLHLTRAVLDGDDGMSILDEVGV